MSNMAYKFKRCKYCLHITVIHEQYVVYYLKSSLNSNSLRILHLVYSPPQVNMLFNPSMQVSVIEVMQQTSFELWEGCVGTPRGFFEDFLLIEIF